MSNSTSGSKKLIVVQGPTGVGKTAVSIALAKHYSAHILSADSRQIYREMSIGTAVPSPEELSAAPHHFIQHSSIHEPVSAGDFEDAAIRCLNEQYHHHDTAILCGGSGLWIDAVLKGFDPLPNSDATLREELSYKSLEELQLTLSELDPAYYAAVDLQNPQRLIRALEVCLTSGRPYSEQRLGRAKERCFTPIKIAITLPREELYRRIDSRVDAMVAGGLVAEAEALYPHRALTALQTVGYSELFDHFDSITTLDEAIELIKRNSRRYAKRQLTWLRRDEQVKWFAPDQISQMIALIDEYN